MTSFSLNCLCQSPTSKYSHIGAMNLVYYMILFTGHSGKGKTTGTKNKSVVSRACSEKRVGQQRNKEDIFYGWYSYLMGLPGGSVLINLPASAEDAGSISGLGRSPGKGNANLL